MSVAIPMLAGLVAFLLGLDVLTGALKAQYAVIDDVLEHYRRVYMASTRIVRARLTLEGSDTVTEAGGLAPVR